MIRYVWYSVRKFVRGVLYLLIGLIFDVFVISTKKVYIIFHQLLETQYLIHYFKYFKLPLMSKMRLNLMESVTLLTSIV